MKRVIVDGILKSLKRQYNSPFLNNTPVTVAIYTYDGKHYINPKVKPLPAKSLPPIDSDVLVYVNPNNPMDIRIGEKQFHK